MLCTLCPQNDICECSQTHLIFHLSLACACSDGTPLRSKRASYGSPSGGSKPGTPQGQEAGRPLPTALMPRTVGAETGLWLAMRGNTGGVSEGSDQDMDKSVFLGRKDVSTGMRYVNYRLVVQAP